MDNKEIKNLIKLFSSSAISELKLKRDKFEIELKKSTGNVVASPVYQEEVPAQQPVIANTAKAPEEKPLLGDCICSPMVGTFYGAPSPEASPFVKVGDSVKKGQSLCIIEAMKIMNEIDAEFDCKIVEILVNDSDAIEYDMPIFRVERI